MPEKEKTKLMLIGFHELFYDGLKLFLKRHNDIELVGYAATGDKILRQLKQELPHVVLIDTDANEQIMNNISDLIKTHYPATAIITFCAPCEEHEVQHRIEAGAKGVLFKTSPKEEIINAVKTVTAKKFYCCPASFDTVMDVVTKRLDPKTSLSPRLTEKEMAVIKLICEEYENKEIAEKLSMSVRTVDDYKRNIADKIGARKTVDIALYAIRNKLVK